MSIASPPIIPKQFIFTKTMTDKINGVQIAEKILEYAENDDSEGILNLAATSGSERLTSSSKSIDGKYSPSLLRKLYLKLSLIIHPDRLARETPNATKAFQALVKAYESLSNPPDFSVLAEGTSSSSSRRGRRGAEAANGPDNILQISRSNENCYRTRVLCPRCKEPWNEGSLDGNPDYCYNFLMTGLKQFTCSTCLCEFGCMTAIHLCPFCSKRFDFAPSQYHQQITCPRENCHRSFGFYLYHISDRKIKEMKGLIKEELQQRLRQRESKLSRQQRSQRRGALDQSEKEAAFLLGLQDVCPRCGEDLSEFAATKEGSELLAQHLMECLDEVKHKQHQKKTAKKLAKEEAKERRKEKQEDAQIHAAWQLFGSNTSQLWLLSEEQLKEEAKQRGLRSDGDKDDLIDRLVQGKDEPLLIQDRTNQRKRKAARSVDIIEIDDDDADDSKEEVKANTKQQTALVKANDNTSAVVVSGGKRRKVNADLLPSNLHSLSVGQLRSMCVANGLKSKIPKNAKKIDLIELMEDATFNEV